MDFFRRKRRDYTPPPPPSEEVTEAVHEAAVTAEIQHERAESRNEEVDRRTARLEHIRSANELGPRFWQAVGQHRSG